MESEVGIMGPKCRHYSQVQNSYMADPYFFGIIFRLPYRVGLERPLFSASLAGTSFACLTYRGRARGIIFLFHLLTGPTFGINTVRVFYVPVPTSRCRGAVLCGVLRLVVRLEGLGLRGVRVSIGVRG